MTIGPDPISRIDWMSVRLGIRARTEAERRTAVERRTAATRASERGPKRSGGPQRPGDQREDRFRVETISSRNSSNRYLASWGPGPASGWYWTLKAGTSRHRNPSTTPSFRLT